MNKYVNLINDDFIINFLNQELNPNYYNNFIVNRNVGGISVNFENGHGNKYGIILTDYYVRTIHQKFSFLEKKWQIELTKKFGYEYLNDLREELSEVIRKRHIREVSDMQII